MTNLVDGAVQYISENLAPAASTVLLAMLAVVGIFAVWRIIRRALGR